MQLYQAGAYDESMVCWRLVTQRDPSQAVAWNNLAHCYFMKNDTAQAELYYRKALEVQFGWTDLTAVAAAAGSSLLLAPSGSLLLRLVAVCRVGK